RGRRGADRWGGARAPVSWAATGFPAGASIDPPPGVVTWIPDCSAHETNGGVYGPLTITATAEEGESDSRSFAIHVSDTPVGIAAVSGLSASTVANGNGSSGTTAIPGQFTPPLCAPSAEVYRAPFGNYPEYAAAPGAGSAPAAPGYPPGPPWAITGVTASGQTDQPAGRDYWSYVAFAKNGCGEVSPASAVSGALDYHLG